MKSFADWSRDDLVDTPVGTLVYNQPIVPDVRGAYFRLRRGTASLCAYLTVPVRHPLQRADWLGGNAVCHGGITYDGRDLSDRNLWAWGWDYGHAWDDSVFEREVENVLGSMRRGSIRQPGRTWLPLDVIKDAEEAIASFTHAIRTAKGVAAFRNEHERPLPLRQGRWASMRKGLMRAGWVK